MHWLIALLPLLCAHTSAQSIAIALLSPRLPPDAHVQLTQEESAVEALFINMPLEEASEFLWTIHDTPHTYGGDHMIDCERISRTDYLLAGAIRYAEMNVSVPAQLADLIGSTLVLTNVDGTTLACASIFPSNEHVDIFITKFDVIKGYVLAFNVANRIKLIANFEASLPVAGGLHWSLTSGDQQEQCDNGLPDSSEAARLRGGGCKYVFAWNHLCIPNATIANPLSIHFDGTLMTLYDNSGALDCAAFRPLNVPLARVALSNAVHYIVQRTPYHAMLILPALNVTERLMVARGASCTHPDDDGSPIEAWSTEDDVMLAASSLYGHYSLFNALLFVDKQCASIEAEVNEHKAALVARFRFPLLAQISIAQLDDIGDALHLRVHYATSALHLQPTVATWRLHTALHYNDSIDTVTCEELKKDTRSSITSGTIVLNGRYAPTESASPTSPQLLMRLRLDALRWHVLVVELNSTAVCASLLPVEYSALMTPVLSATLYRHLPLRHDHIGTLIVAHDGLRLALTDEKLLQANWTLEIHEHPTDESTIAGGPCGWRSVGDRWLPAMSVVRRLRYNSASLDGIFSVPMSVDEVGELWRWRGKTAVLSNVDDMGDAICGNLDDAVRSERAHARAHISADWIDVFVDFYEIDSTRTLLVIDSNVYETDVSALYWHIVGGGEQTPASCRTGTDVLRDSYSPYAIDSLSEEYFRTCDTMHWHLCTVGDLSGKTLNSTLRANARYTITVPMLPIATDATSIIGAQLLVSNALNASRVECAIIKKIDSLSIRITADRHRDRNDIQDAIRNAISTSENTVDNRSITVRYTRSILSARCHTFNVVISDDAAYINRLRNKIEEIISQVEIAVKGTQCFDEPIKVPRKAIRTMSSLGQGAAVLHSASMIRVLSLLCHLLLALGTIS